MRLASRLTGRHELTALGKQWGVVFTHGALLHIEELTSIDVLGAGLRFNASMSARVLRAVLFAVLRDAGCPIAIEEAGAMLRLGELAAIRGVLVSAWVDSMPQPGVAPASSGGGRRMSWLSAWAIARQDLGLSDEEWLAMTPRMAQALSLQRIERQRELELMVAVLTANTINFSSCHPSKAVLPREFMLHPWPASPSKPVTSVDLGRVFDRFSGAKRKK